MSAERNDIYLHYFCISSIHHLEASHGEPGEICVSAELVCQNWQNVQSEQLPIHQVIVSAASNTTQTI